MAADRRAYAERQAQLLRALVAGEGFPEGFAADKAAEASRSLRRKRGRIVAKAWPALVLELGERFDARVELLFARVRSARGAGTARARRGPFLGTIVLREPRRLLVVVRLPRGGPRSLVVRAGRG